GVPLAPSLGEPMRRREHRSVVAAEPVGPYVLVRVTRGGLAPGVPGQFFMLEAPGRLLPRPMSLCLAPRGELAFLIDPIGPGTRALCSLERGDSLDVYGPLGNGFRLDVERPLLVGGGVRGGPFPHRARGLPRPPAGGAGLPEGVSRRSCAPFAGGRDSDRPRSRDRRNRAGVRPPRVRAGADARGGPGELAASAARLGGTDGVRLRRLLRMCGRD